MFLVKTFKKVPIYNELDAREIVQYKVQTMNLVMTLMYDVIA